MNNLTPTEEILFTDAVAMAVSQRAGYLDQKCGGDAALRQRLEKLLAAHEGENGILDLAETHIHNRQTLDMAAGQDIGAYHLLEKIGEGGFGVVFLAEQRQPIQRKVAIKVIKPGMDSKAVVARFEGERQALAMMDHPNIASVFDGGASHDGQRPYFVMELVQGVPITEFCDANSLTTRERLELFVSVCNAVQHAHQKGIIHRDIKPNNVMVTLHDDKPVAKVIDFGVAKALHQRLTEKTMFTQFGMMVGTPQYMSPEQAGMTGLDVDTRSDVYSLAVLLYELLTGTTPLKTATMQAAGIKEMQRMICEDEAERPSLRLSSSGEKLTVLAKHRNVAPSRLTKEINDDLDWIVMKGLEKNRTRRYDSANSLAADIQRALNNQLVLAGPPSFSYRAKKFASRNRNGLAFAAALAAVVVTVAFGFINHRMHQLAATEKDEVRLNNAIDEANEAVSAAVEASTSSERWTAAALMAARVSELVDEFSTNSVSLSRAEQFLDRYENTRQDKEFIFSMQELLINQSTDQSIGSLQFMEKEFRQILRKRGYDLAKMSPDETATQLSKDRTPLKITDAFELWLSVRIKLNDAGEQEISDREVKQWTDAMCSADPNPMRSAIRKTIFRTVAPDKTFLNSSVTEEDLATSCARKLSWLAEAYQLVQQPDRAEEIRDYALSKHSGDLLLNFENAMRLMELEQYDQASRYFMRCTSIRPKISGVWRGLSKALGRNGELSQAQTAINRAIQLSPEDASLYVLLSEWLLQDDKPQAAIGAAEKALSLGQEVPAAWKVIGRANMEIQNYIEALVAFKNIRKQEHTKEIDDWIKECQRRIVSSIKNEQAD
jgi:serine/threonine-protein kinase